MGMKRLLMIFTMLVIVMAGVLGWRGESALALMLGGGGAVVLFLLAAFGRRGLNADLPPEARERWRSLDL